MNFTIIHLQPLPSEIRCERISPVVNMDTTAGYSDWYQTQLILHVPGTTCAPPVTYQTLYTNVYQSIAISTINSCWFIGCLCPTPVFTLLWLYRILSIRYSINHLPIIHTPPTHHTPTYPSYTHLPIIHPPTHHIPTYPSYTHQPIIHPPTHHTPTYPSYTHLPIIHPPTHHIPTYPSYTHLPIIHPPTHHTPTYPSYTHLPIIHPPTHHTPTISFTHL